VVAKRLSVIVIAGIVAVGCGGATARTAAARPAALAQWTGYIRANSPIDVVGPRADGKLIVAADGRLRLLSRSGRLQPFAPTYNIGPGPEAYIALASVGRPGCSFGADTVYVISFAKPRGLLAVSAKGHIRRFATITAPGLTDGIAFDDTGRFGYRLLVATTNGPLTTVDAVDCHGNVRVITTKAHRAEGGVAVAPASFGRFGGDLIESDELGGGIYAVTPAGGNRLVANSGLPHGGDTGVESEAFLPARGRFAALLADRLTPGNPHPGNNLLLRVSSAALFAAGARAGDLLDATEGGAKTVAVHCGPSGCTVRRVANGPAIAHPEGHIAIVPR
jgi:hypothetical protein